MRKQQSVENWISLHEGQPQVEYPNETIQSSWKRSETKNIDYVRALPKELTQSELERTKKVYKRLLICSDWAINHLVENSIDSEVRVLLFSKDGVLLRIYGKTSDDDWLSFCGIKSGTKWSEESIGTNPFSLGMLNKRAVELPGSFNY